MTIIGAVGCVCCVILVVELSRIDYWDHVQGSGSFWKKLISSPPNEVGDALAGIFGTLAFLAAALAVVMQSVELREQRKEFREQRIATQAMAVAMEEQSKVFKDEQMQRQEDRAARYFEQSLLRLINKANELAHLAEVRFPVVGTDFRNGVAQHEHKIRLLAVSNPTITIDEQVRQINDNSMSALKTLAHLMKDSLISKRPNHILAEIILANMSDIERQVENLSDDQKLRWMNTNLLHAKENWERLAKMPIWDVKQVSK